jgi:phospholipase C
MARAGRSRFSAHKALAAAALLVLLLPATTIAHSIRHVVVLMMENRSFDHMLGYMYKENPEIDGLRGNESNPYDPADPNSPVIVVSDQAEFVDPDPGHGQIATTEHVFGFRTQCAAPECPNPAPMNGFVSQAESIRKGMGQNVMRSFKPENVPVISEMAREFAVFDRWYSSVPGPTQPNRMYLHSASSHGMAHNDERQLAIGFTAKCIFEQLSENGVSWKSYFQLVPATVFFKWMRRRENWGNFHHYSKFKEDAASGNLPAYSFIDPFYFDTPNKAGNDDHPSHDVSEGQKLMKDLYDTLRASPVWENTLLLITYDEHGGFHDHVPTPLDGVPNPDGLIDNDPYFLFDRLGVRVPTIAISPWIPKGLVVHDPINGPEPTSKYEHSSLPRTLQKLFNINETLTRRDAWASSFEHILSLDTPRQDCPLTMPEVTQSLRHFPQDGQASLSPLQREFVAMASGLNEANSDKIEIGEHMTVLQAARYIREQVNKFFGRDMYPADFVL